MYADDYSTNFGDLLSCYSGNAVNSQFFKIAGGFSFQNKIFTRKQTAKKMFK